MAYVRIFAHQDTLLLGHLHNLLKQAGIPCEMRNLWLAGGAGDLPLGECEPELWVSDHNQVRATQLIHSELYTPLPAWPQWCCEQCGEWNEGQFAVCWQCEAPCPLPPPTDGD